MSKAINQILFTMGFNFKLDFAYIEQMDAFDLSGINILISQSTNR